MTTKIETLSGMTHYLEYNKHDFVVVCGYDNVGKGLLMEQLFDKIPKFHPDYSLICDQVTRSGRWSFFMYFLDLYNQLKPSIDLRNPLVFDRSSICGSVYNNDCKIAIEYAKKIKDLNVLHILVTVEDEESYNKLNNVRANESKSDYHDYLIYTERYRAYMDLLGIEYVEYVNAYNEELGEYLTKVCGGCSHYKSGKCTNDLTDVDHVNFESERCEHSSVREVQDLDEQV